MLIGIALILIAGCGQSYYFGGRALPPSGILNRVMIAIQNVGITGSGSLAIVDGYYDIRHSFNNITPSFAISGYSAPDPITIQNMPEQQLGAVYAAGNGTFTLVNYGSESQVSAISGLAGLSSSIFISRDQNYVFAASQQSQVLTVIDRTLSVGGTYTLNVPNVWRVSINPGATVALAFAENSNALYRVFKLQANQAPPSNAVDCEPQNLPVYCVIPVPGSFDRPIKAVFSSDGTTAYVLNCGPECGGKQASVSFLPTTGLLIQSGSPVPPGAKTEVTATVPIPGGATNALATTNTLYLAGQQLQSDGLFAGYLTLLDLASQKISGQFPISDGSHTQMVMADDNTLWIGSQLCEDGQRAHELEDGVALQVGCLAMFNTANNSVTMIDAYKGDATGVAAVTGLHKVYTAEGGQVYIYSTTNGATLDNSNVTVTGTAYAVAYIDAASDDDNTTY